VNRGRSEGNGQRRVSDPGDEIGVCQDNALGVSGRSWM
jgi:hypothetical protein